MTVFEGPYKLTVELEVWAWTDEKVQEVVDGVVTPLRSAQIGVAGNVNAKRWTIEDRRNMAGLVEK